MATHSLNQKLSLIRSLFKAREDVFAIYWQKGSKSGYMPAIEYDPYMYRLHKMRGGTLKDYADKKYLPLGDQQIIKHLNGEQLIGVYPLLTNNTSWFIAADFDGPKWMDECRGFIEICRNNDIPAYLERSRSGNGGHVWIFFDATYPANRSRKILKSLLEQAGICSVFDNSSSFDRLFPNQDFHSGKGLGNLIALPFHRPAFIKGNSCFVNPEEIDLPAYSDQWVFMSAIQKVTIAHLDMLYGKIDAETIINKSIQNNSKQLKVVLDNDVRLTRSGITPILINFLKKELNVINSDFIIKTKIGKNTWGTNKYYKCFVETENELIIPRGFIGKFLRFCKDKKLNDLDKLSHGQSLYSNEEDFLNDLLKDKRVKHYRQLRYLASRHESNTMKLRFVLNFLFFFFWYNVRFKRAL